jgi:hypothetical protein
MPASTLFPEENRPGAPDCSGKEIRSLNFSIFTGEEDMFGFSTADWIFIGVILAVIFVCVAVSDMKFRKGADK